MMNYFLSAFFVFLQLSFVFSQEGIRPLFSNINYAYPDLKPFDFKTQKVNQNKSQVVSLQLPFLDDFSYCTSSAYPNQILWNDSSTFINSGYPVAPPSIGVATFDGLNKFGYPYNPTLSNLNQSKPADTLESQAINLHQIGAQVLLPSDSIALSFYYQARGNGEPPESSDSLLLDFYNPVTNKWNASVWFTKGNANSSINDTVFKRGFIMIKDTNYLQDGFKFRFRNWATTSGNFDHWHIDYVYLNKNRSTKADTVYNDITFGNVPSSFLKNFSAMPYEQYVDAEMATKNSVRIKNSGLQTVNMTYENKIFDKTGLQIHAYSGGADNLPPFRTAGYSSITAHSNPTFNYTFAPLQDSADFKIKHYVYRSSGLSSDFIVPNDTVIQYQQFRNYYAFDDGAAEAGYFINGVGGKMALKINVNVTDTFRAARIYFDHDGSSTLSQTSYSLRICVWAAGANGPTSTLLLRDSLVLPKYRSNGYNLFSEYKLTTPMVLNPGIYYIGFQQFVATGVTVGFDVNLDNRTSLYFNSGNGWTQSQIKGSLMFRPVFGKKIVPSVSIKENVFAQQDMFSVYPNPAADYFIIQSSNFKTATFQLINALGQVVRDEKILQKISDENSEEYVVNTADLNNGVYFLILKNNNRIVQQHKIIIQH